MFRLPTKKFGNLFFLLLLFADLRISAQATYSTRYDYLSLKPESNNLFSEYRYDYPDTSLTNEHNYFPRNFMGNVGLPSPNYILTYGTPRLGFILFNPPSQIDRFYEHEINYYQAKGPYARLTGIAGSSELQIFKMSFIMNFRRVNVSIRFNRYTSRGFYLNQQTYTNNFYLTSNYSTRNDRFGYYFFILNNSNKNQENGGIQDSVLTDSTAQMNKELLRVRISGANRTNTETKVMLNPWFRLNRNSDSLKGLNHYLQLKSSVAFQLFRYSDGRSGSDQFYHLFYIDTAKTFDSTHVTQFSNQVDYSLMTANKRSGLSLGYRNELNTAWQYGKNIHDNHLLVAGAMYRADLKDNDTLHKTNRFFESHADAQAVFAGYNEGNMKLESRSRLVLNADKKREVFLSALFEKRSPDYIYNNWISNHFLWTGNGYEPQQQMQVLLGFRAKHVSASLFYQNVFNLLYFDQVAFPRQYGGNIGNAGITLSYSNIFFRHLGVDVSHTFQNTSNDLYVRLPASITTAKLFFAASLFRHNMQIQLGGQVQLYQSFKGYAYMPATEVFYLQNHQATGTYPYVDVYLNARIRPVSVFLKIENALQGLVGNNYSFVPGYYQPDMAFRFGISWMFFD